MCAELGEIELDGIAVSGIESLWTPVSWFDLVDCNIVGMKITNAKINAAFRYDPVLIIISVFRGRLSYDLLVTYE